MLSFEQFVKHLRAALNHLYDPNHLRRSPLAALFGVADRFDTPTALQRLLMEAIEALKPAANEPSDSHAWETYEPLYYRYVQQWEPAEIADQMGIGKRHLRRKLRAALEILAYQLWAQFDLAAIPDASETVRPTFEPKAASNSAVYEELAWLKDAAPERPTILAQSLADVADFVQPLAAQYQLVLNIVTPDTLPDLAVHPVAFRQTLLNLLSIAIHRADGGQIDVLVKPLSWEVEIQVQCSANIRVRSQSIAPRDTVSLDLTYQLTELCGGRLTHTEKGKSFTATLILPALEQLPVLVIDDNADTLQLLQRYAAGTRYRLIEVQDPKRALSLVEKYRPQIIILDVMMPQIDGWKVLRRLRQHPLTQHTSIVVCSIVLQDDLALSLGANAFLRKPITRKEFLAILDRQIEPAASKPG